jgi:hypothetical protein
MNDAIALKFEVRVRSLTNHVRCIGTAWSGIIILECNNLSNRENSHELFVCLTTVSMDNHEPSLSEGGYPTSIKNFYPLQAAWRKSFFQRLCHTRRNRSGLWSA